MAIVQPAIFLDRDGVINENRADHVLSWATFQPVRGALAGIRFLTRLGMPIIVVTNQAVVGRGAMTRGDLDDLHARMTDLVARHGGRITGVYACMHRPEDECDCRKPRPGLFLQAAHEHRIDLSASYYVGDALTDVAAGQAAGCTTIVVRTGRGRTQILRPQAQSYSDYYLAHDLPHAAQFIIHRHASRSGRSPLRTRLHLALRGVQSL